MNVPSTAVRIGGNYIDCIPHSSFLEQPCKVYDGSTGRVLDLLTERLRLISSTPGGAPPVDCGTASMSKANPRVAECGQAALQDRKPFFAQYRNDIAQFTYAYGVASDANGNVSWMVYSSREFPSVPPTPRTQLLDENHTRLTPCIRPVNLGTTEEGMLACVTPVNQEASRNALGQRPIATSVCAILENPSAFNNKLVRIRGHVSGNFEYSMLSGNGCSDSIWFDYPSDGPPGLVAYVPGGAVPGAEDAEGRRIQPIPVTLVRDANFDRFQRLMRARAEADERSYRRNPKEHASFQVTATFVGRIDGVSPEIRAFHRKRSAMDRADFLGFGQMGLFDAQFIMQSVGNDAVLGREPH